MIPSTTAETDKQISKSSSAGDACMGLHAALRNAMRGAEQELAQYLHQREREYIDEICRLHRRLELQVNENKRLAKLVHVEQPLPATTTHELKERARFGPSPQRRQPTHEFEDLEDSQQSSDEETGWCSSPSNLGYLEHIANNPIRPRESDIVVVEEYTFQDQRHTSDQQECNQQTRTKDPKQLEAGCWALQVKDICTQIDLQDDVTGLPRTVEYVYKCCRNGAKTKI